MDVLRRAQIEEQEEKRKEILENQKPGGAYPSVNPENAMDFYDDGITEENLDNNQWYKPGQFRKDKRQ